MKDYRKKVFSILVLVFLFPLSSHSQQKSIHLNKVVAKLERNQLVTGIWVQSTSLSSAIGIIEYNGYPTEEEALTKPMIDFVLIEMEHEPFDVSHLRTFLLGLNSKREVLVRKNLQPSLAVFVRLPVEGHDPVHAQIKQALDMGVHGVVIPHVQTAEEALKIVKACRYIQPLESSYPEPKGNRGASPWICSYLWGLTLPEYVQHADVWPLNPSGDIMAIIMIEDEVGVKNIGSILEVPGLGAVIFGPYDYSFSSGSFGDTGAPAVKAAWEKVKEACDRANVPLIGFAGVDDIEAKVKENYRMLLIGTNVDISGGPGKVLDILRKKNSR